MIRLSLPLSVLVVLGVLFTAPPPAAAQSAETVIEQMKARHKQQLASVDNYIIKTNLYTSYHRKVTNNGQATYESTTRMSGQSQTLSAMGTPPTTTSDAAYLDRLVEHATYGGLETVNGARSHVLHIDDPGAVYEDMNNDAAEMTYYVDTETYTPTRMIMTMMRENESGSPARMTIDFKDHRTVKGLTLPYVMVMTMNMGLSDAERQQLQQLQEQLKQMPEQQREQMKRMMGKQFEQMQNMMAGEPTTITVESVTVNEGIPTGIFSDASSGS